VNYTKHVEGLLTRLAHLGERRDVDGVIVEPKGGTRSELDKLRHRLLAAIHRDLTGAPVFDGHRRSSAAGAGGRGGGPVVIVELEDGTKEAVKVTAVEAAAFARVDGNQLPDDLLHDHVVALMRFLETAVGALDSIYARLALIDAIKEAADVRHDPSGYCLVCTRYVPGIPEDRLRRGMCPSDYRAWVRADRPELVEFTRMRNNGEIPDTPNEENHMDDSEATDAN